MAVDKLNAFPYIITTAPVEITTGAASFANAEDLANVRTYQGGAAITWQTFDWSNIPAETLADWLVGASDLPASTSLIELSPDNFITGAALITEGSDGSQAALSVNIDTATNDLFTDYLIYYGTEVPSSLTVTHTANLQSAVRSLDPTADDWTVFTAHNDATRLSELQALADTPKALHLWTDAAGTGSAAFDIPDVKTFNHYDHRDNREAMPYLQGNAQDFDGLTVYNHFTASNNTPEKNVEQVFIFGFNYTPTGGGQLVLGGTRDNTNDLPHYQFNIVPTGGVFQLVMRANWTSGTTTQNAWRGTRGLKDGYNCVIVHFRDYTVGTGVDFYINGIKDTLTFSQLAGGITAGTSFAVAKNYSIGRLTDTWGLPSNLTGSYFNGSMKVLQWLDVTGQTINAAKIKAVAEQHDARNILDFTNAVLDVDFSTNPVSDRSANTYGITTFNGLTQTTYL